MGGHIEAVAVRRAQVAHCGQAFIPGTRAGGGEGASLNELAPTASSGSKVDGNCSKIVFINVLWLY